MADHSSPLEKMLTDQLAQYEEENQRLRNIIDSNVAEQLAWQQDYEAAELIRKVLEGPSTKGDPTQQDILRKRLHELLLNGVTFPSTDGKSAA